MTTHQQSVKTLVHMVLNAQLRKTTVSAGLAETAGTSQYQMSPTQVTKNYAINIDHALGRSLGQLSGAWVYKTGQNNVIIDDGVPVIFTNKHSLELFWSWIAWESSDSEAMPNTRFLKEMTSYAKNKVKEAILARLLKDKFLTSGGTQG
jgi:hypothetical protein